MILLWWARFPKKSAASTSPWKRCPLDKLCFREPHHHSISFPLPLHRYLLDPFNILDTGVHQSVYNIKCLPSAKQGDKSEHLYFIVVGSKEIIDLFLFRPCINIFVNNIICFYWHLHGQQ